MTDRPPHGRASLRLRQVFCACTAFVWAASPLAAQVAIQGDRVYTMSGPPIEDALVVIKKGKMTEERYYPNCRITDAREIFSGKVHTLIVNHDQQEYYFDDLFLAVLENINSPEKNRQLIESFNCTEEEYESARKLILDGKFVILKSEIEPVRIGILT